MFFSRLYNQHVARLTKLIKSVKTTLYKRGPFEKEYVRANRSILKKV